MSVRSLPDPSSAVGWTPPEEWIRVRTIDAHTEGEPLRVILAGFPDPAGSSILDRRAYARERLDHLRTALMWEPRGHADMYGCLITPPVSEDADFGVLFLHNEGYSTMCGHGIIAVATVVLETRLLPVAAPTERWTRLRIDTPAGLVTAFAEMAGGRVARVRFRNVPSYVVALDREVEVPGIGPVRYDLAFGGAYYAYVDAYEAGVELVPEECARIVERGMAVKRAVSRAHPIEHPEDSDLAFLYGTIFLGPPASAGSHSRNVCVFADGEVDRSPTGTGVSGRMAIHHARGEVGLDEPLVIESILGTTFTGRVVEETRFGPYAAVIPEVEGRAWLTGRHEFWIDPDDPLRHGFLLR